MAGCQSALSAPWASRVGVSAELVFVVFFHRWPKLPSGGFDHLWAETDWRAIERRTTTLTRHGSGPPAVYVKVQYLGLFVPKLVADRNNYFRPLPGGQELPLDTIAR